MASFTDDEIQAAVEALVQNTIRRPYDTLGVRRSDLAFSDIQQAAAGVFLLYPKAPFYCLYLGAQSVLEDIKAEAQLIDLLLETIGSTGRSVVPVEDVSPLFNASAALASLGQAAIQRNTGFKDISVVPAYQQFTKSVDRFLNTAGQAIRENGQVVQTPQEGRKKLSSLVSQLESAHTKLVTRVGLLSSGIEDFNKLNLSGLIAQSVIAKAGAVIDTHAQELNLLLPEQRLEKVRQVVLDLLAAKSVVTTYGSFGGATDSHFLTGTGTPYADATHLAESALLRVGIPGPYDIQAGSNVLDLFLDAAGTAAPRSLLSATSLTAGSNNSAVLAVPSVPGDVVPGDVVYPSSGPNSGAKFTVVSTGVGILNLAGLVPAINDAGPISLEVRPPPSVVVPLPFAFSATIHGTRQEEVFTSGSGFLIGDGTLPTRFSTSSTIPNNRRIVFLIDGVSYTVSLTLSTSGVVGVSDAIPRTAQQVCDDINAILVPSSNFMAEPYLNPRRFQGLLVQTATGGATATFDLLGGFGNFGALGISIGDVLNVIDGLTGQQGIWNITALTSTQLTATNALGTTAVSQAKVLGEVGSALRAIKVRAINPHLACTSLSTLSVQATGPATDSYNCGVSLGLTPGGVSTSRLQTAKELVQAIQGASSLVKAQATMVPTQVGVRGHSEPTLSTRLVLAKFKAVADTSYSGTLTATAAGALTAGVTVGDKLIERGGSHIGTRYLVTSVTDTAIAATLISGTPTSQTGVTIEVGRASVLPYDLIRITDGPNTGDYYVQGSTDFDIDLLTPLPLNIDPATGQEVVFTVTLGPEFLEILSANKTTASFVRARGNAPKEMFSSPLPTGAGGTTRYFRLPKKIPALAPNDLLLFFATQYNLPSAERVITAVEADVLTLDQPISSSVSWVFDPAAVPPFAELRAGAFFDFDAFKALLEGWLSKDTQQHAYFTDLNRFINPLIFNSSPTSVAVGDALNRVKDLAKELTIVGATSFGGTDPIEFSLDTFVIEHQPAIDSLIRSFKEKGADRAIDFLIGGQFQGFFSLNKDTSSYAGAMQSSMRDVVRNDLSVRKLDRKDAKVSRLLASSTDTDPDDDHSDAENAVPDPVGQGDF